MKTQVIAAIAATVFPLCASAQITGTFVAAQDGVNSFQSVDGTSLFSSTERTLDLWHERTGVFNIAGVDPSGAYQGQDKAGVTPNPTANEVVTTITGLTPGTSYDIYIVMGINTGGKSGRQDIDAGFESGNLTTFSEAASVNTGLSLGAGGTWVAAESLIGSKIADANGEIKVYVNATKGAERSVYNGLSYIVSPPPTPVAHYWDFNVDTGLIPYVAPDRVGNLDLTEVGVTDVAVDDTYGEAFPGASFSLNSERGVFAHFSADTYNGARATALDFGMDDFAISYWVYDDASDNDVGGPDEDLRGARVLDCANSVNGGVEISVDADGYFSLRIDDLDGNQTVSTKATGTPYETLVMPTDKWVHVAINVDRANKQVTVYFDGVSQGSYDISVLAGEIACTQDLMVGVIAGIDGDAAQKSGLDELAFYPALLTADEVAGLAAATLSPADILPKPPGDAPVITAIAYDAGTGTATITFPTAIGATYTVEGSGDLESWLPLDGTDATPIDGTGADVSFDHAPGQTDYFYRVIRNE